MNIQKTLWVAWEKDASIRSRILAKEMKADYYTFTAFEGRKYFASIRYIVAVIQTLLILLKMKPIILVVQNPSIVLCFLSSITKKLFGYKLIVDLHTQYIHPGKVRKFIMNYMNKYSLNRCDIIVVTNDNYKNDIKDITDKTIYVLPDKIPHFDYEFNRLTLKGKSNVLFICTFSEDEPWEEVLEASRLLGNDFCIYISGKPKIKEMNIPENIILTGYVPNEQYQNLLRSVDVVLVLTVEDNCMVCGAYEAVAAEKALILSDKRVLREYFNRGVVFTENKSNSIAEAIKYAVERQNVLHEEILEIKSIRSMEWKTRWETLMEYINTEININKRDDKKSVC